MITIECFRILSHITYLKNLFQIHNRSLTLICGEYRIRTDDPLRARQVL